MNMFWRKKESSREDWPYIRGVVSFHLSLPSLYVLPGVKISYCVLALSIKVWVRHRLSKLAHVTSEALWPCRSTGDHAPSICFFDQAFFSAFATPGPHKNSKGDLYASINCQQTRTLANRGLTTFIYTFLWLCIHHAIRSVRVLADVWNIVDDTGPRPADLCDCQQVGSDLDDGNSDHRPAVDKRSVVLPGRSNGASSVRLSRRVFFLTSVELSSLTFCPESKVVVSSCVENWPHFMHYHVHEVVMCTLVSCGSASDSCEVPRLKAATARQ